MPGFTVSAVGLTDPPPMEGRTIALHLMPDMIELYVINAGTSGGQPSVALVIDTSEGLLIVETTLLAYNASARGAMAMAETQFGWEMPP